MSGSLYSAPPVMPAAQPIGGGGGTSGLAQAIAGRPSNFSLPSYSSNLSVPLMSMLMQQQNQQAPGAANPSGGGSVNPPGATLPQYIQQMMSPPATSGIGATLANGGIDPSTQAQGPGVMANLFGQPGAQNSY